MAQDDRLSEEAEVLLRLLAAGESVEASSVADEVAEPLRLGGLLQILNGAPAITPLGRLYVHAVDDVRAPAVVRAVEVDTRERTVCVEVAAWRLDELVTVPLDQVVAESELDVEALAGEWLIADANCAAPSPDRLVLTRFRVPAAPPSGWMGAAQ
ncbi:hypothetical protein ACFWH1_18800 [Streptomyces sp. NPDC127037]|uniref:hypothetical protein n=1 Tax=Streptomyces sp. NPDC127037 TaxID=3347113 RepID=UPI00365A6955